jgi:hypothetical protein
MFALIGADHIPFPRCGLSRDDALRQCLADTEGPEAEEEGSAYPLKRVHDGFL